MKIGKEFWKSFFKYNLVSILATLVDFLFFVLFTKVFLVWYVLSTVISAIIGGITAFWLNRVWVFVSKDEKIVAQFAKYATVWTGSIFLNAAGIYLLVENTQWDEVVSKVIVSIIVGIGFNFFMSKYFIFKDVTK